MVRPTDWDVLGLDHDPTPGDPFQAVEISGRMRDIGDEAERACRDVRGLAGDDAVMGWIGASGDAFRTHIGKFPGQLDKVATSHHLCADALLEFSTALDTYQSQADRALVQARPLHDQRPGFTLFRWEDPLSKSMNNIAPAPGFFDVGVHGQPDSVGYQFKGWLGSGNGLTGASSVTMMSRI